MFTHFLVYVHVLYRALLYIAISVGKGNSQTTCSSKNGNSSKNVILTVVCINISLQYNSTECNWNGARIIVIVQQMICLKNNHNQRVRWYFLCRDGTEKQWLKSLIIYIVKLPNLGLFSEYRITTIFACV